MGGEDRTGGPDLSGQDLKTKISLAGEAGVPGRLESDYFFIISSSFFP